MRSAVSVVWIRFGGLGGVWRRGHGPPGPFLLCRQHCYGGGPLPSSGPLSAPCWGMLACAVLLMCINKPPWPESLASPWALGGAGGHVIGSQRSLRGSAPQDRPAGMVSKPVTNLAAGSGAQEAEVHLQRGRDFGGHLELSHTSQKGKLRPLRGEPIAI